MPGPTRSGLPRTRRRPKTPTTRPLLRCLPPCCPKSDGSSHPTRAPKAGHRQEPAGAGERRILNLPFSGLVEERVAMKASNPRRAARVVNSERTESVHLYRFDRSGNEVPRHPKVLADLVRVSKRYLALIG